MKVLIACGGTGGHLFPGLAVAEMLAARRHQVKLLVSEKTVDQVAVGHPAMVSSQRVLASQDAAGRSGLGRDVSCCSRRVLANALARALPCRLNVISMCSSKLKKPKYCCR